MYSPAMQAERVIAWAKFQKDIREFFVAAGYTEVTTPILVEAGAFESSLDCLSASWGNGAAELHTSPEIEMKSLLAQIQMPIFQIARCFRDDPTTPYHRREFTMLEFYRPNANYLEVMRVTQELFAFTARKPIEFKELTVREAFLLATGIDLNLMKNAEQFANEVRERDLISLSSDDSWDDIYFKLLLEKVEPSLDPQIFTILKEYPPSQAALAGLSPDGKFAERFECYTKGVELCNGCTEAGNPEELLARYEVESQARRKRGKAPHPFPQKLVDAARKMPPCAGVAVGLDRLFLCLRGFPLL